MLMAARRLQDVGVVVLLLAFAMLLYPLSLKVAATRSEAAELSRQLSQTRSKIRYLEGELAVRAAHGQLDRWNRDTFGYVVPAASQYVVSEARLAKLDRLPRLPGATPMPPLVLALAAPDGAMPAPGGAATLGSMIEDGAVGDGAAEDGAAEDRAAEDRAATLAARLRMVSPVGAVSTAAAAGATGPQ